MRTERWLRFGAAALGATAGIALAIGGMALFGLPAYLVGVLVVVPTLMVMAGWPKWRLEDVLIAGAGTLFGPGLLLMVPVAVNVARGTEDAVVLVFAPLFTALYFTGLSTVVGLLASILFMSKRVPNEAGPGAVDAA